MQTCLENRSVVWGAGGHSDSAIHRTHGGGATEHQRGTIAATALHCPCPSLSKSVGARHLSCNLRREGGQPSSMAALRCPCPRKSAEMWHLSCELRWGGQVAECQTALRCPCPRLSKSELRQGGCNGYFLYVSDCFVGRGMYREKLLFSIYVTV